MNRIIKSGVVIVFCLVIFFGCGDGGGGGGGGNDDDDPICTDIDADGYFAESGCGTLVDCNDNAANVNPGETEICNSVDDDCDGSVDEGVTSTYYGDGDGDTYGNAAVSTQACLAPAGYVSDNTDCNDGNATTNPGVTETPYNGKDDDCDAATLDDDLDEDSFLNANDCDDDDAAVNPGETEILYNGKDDDCDAATLDDDLDEDGFLNTDDCDDDDPAVNPDATEICNDYIDNDCDDTIDCGDGDCAGPPADPSCVANDFYNSLGMGFQLISAGTFTMGSPLGELGRGTDETQTIVELTQNFYMQTTEVTQGQWMAVMDSNPSYFSSCGNDCPVEQVSWNDVQTFISELNDMEEGTYRLPSEAEWEYAARAGSSTAFENGDITTYGDMDECNPDGNLNDMGWYCNNSSVSYEGCWDLLLNGSCFGSHPVEGKNANDEDLYDMHGNLWEWCQDWYDEDTYLGGPFTGPFSDPTGPESGTEKVLRGGSWAGVPRESRSATRSSDDTGVVTINIGFRLVRVAE